MKTSAIFGKIFSSKEVNILDCLSSKEPGRAQLLITFCVLPSELEGRVTVLGVICPFLYATFRLKRVNNEKIWALFTHRTVRTDPYIGKNLPIYMGRYHRIPWPILGIWKDFMAIHEWLCKDLGHLLCNSAQYIITTEPYSFDNVIKTRRMVANHEKSWKTVSIIISIFHNASWYIQMWLPVR